MNIEEIDPRTLKYRLKSPAGLPIEVGNFIFSIHSRIESIAKNLRELYGEFSIAQECEVVDFDIRIDKARGLRRWLKPQVYFYLDGHSPFLPLPASQAFPLLEWGMNWCLAQHSLNYLTLHAAVLEKSGACVILPAESGSGKSTLTAILANNGWRLLSDEMTLISLKDLSITSLARPVSLKNNSINLIKKRFPEAIFSDIVDDTNKGTISHMKAPSNSIQNVLTKAKATTIIFPKYTPTVDSELNKKEKGSAFMEIIENSFNYNLLAIDGFLTLSKLVEDCDTYSFNYSKVESAIKVFQKLADQHA